MQLNLSVLLLLGLTACIWGFDDLDAYEQDSQLLAENRDWAPIDVEQQHRVRRQLNVQGGGSPRQGFDLSVNGRAPVWQSPNGRHSVDATGQYSQHLGGPYGNSRPNWGAGAMYTFRF
ncbi:diptericin-D [Drosophila grimshawi]|uniref:GH22132 n=1 Tax=Drosophila grimshawi TaxID=7222 RepID=B4J4K4_DROGR|nr:diptericin-D [Drosophila grimshawi]EDW02709.1 GH22132 [Drosophila grimshawi]